MSTEIILYPKSAGKKGLRRLLVSLGFFKCEHLWEWPAGAEHFFWFDQTDFRSNDGVEATIFTPSEESQRKYGYCSWALHTRTRASAGTFDKAQQNNVIRSARKAFGGNFYNDWFGVNRYTPLWTDDRGPAGRGICQSYEYVKARLSIVRAAIPAPLMNRDAAKSTVGEFLRSTEPANSLYSALVPLAVAALEHFFTQSFTILLRYDSNARKKLSGQSRKMDLKDVLAITDQKMTIEGTIASWYSFQNIDQIHSAFKEWFGIDFWKLIRRRKKIGTRVPVLAERFQEVINFRHGVIHRFEFDPPIDPKEIDEIFDLVVALIELFINHLESERGIKVLYSQAD